MRFTGRIPAAYKEKRRYSKLHVDRAGDRNAAKRGCGRRVDLETEHLAMTPRDDGSEALASISTVKVPTNKNQSTLIRLTVSSAFREASAESRCLIGRTDGYPLFRTDERAAQVLTSGTKRETRRILRVGAAEFKRSVIGRANAPSSETRKNKLFPNTR